VLAAGCGPRRRPRLDRLVLALGVADVGINPRSPCASALGVALDVGLVSIAMLALVWPSTSASSSIAVRADIPVLCPAFPRSDPRLVFAYWAAATKSVFPATA
jgi:hypothetical protein